MDPVLVNWLIKRLGPDFVPDAASFCTTMADGTLLAKMLYSYGIIDVKQKETIQVSNETSVRLKNLKYLMSFFKAMKIKVEKDVLLKVLKEDEANAIRLMYKLYTRLEPNSALRLEVEQKEKELTGKYTPRFTLTKVRKPEASTKGMMAVNPLIAPMNEKSDVIAWHRKKYEQMMNKLKENRRRIAERTSRLSAEKGRGDAETCADFDRYNFKEAQKEMEAFDNICKDEEEKDIPMSQLLMEQVRGENLYRNTQIDSEKTRDYVPCIRRKFKRDEIRRKIKKSIEKVLISEAWEKLTREQESEFNLIVTKKLLKQSQYEKNILSKLHEIRDEKMRIIKNRKFVQNLIFKEIGTEGEGKWMRELTDAAESFRQQKKRKTIEVDYERKLNEEKMRLEKEKCTRICTDAVSDMVDVAIKSSEFVAKNDTSVPQKMWNEWKVLFINSQPIFEVLENIEDILEPEGDEDFEAKREIEAHRQQVLDEADFEAYMELKGPWLLEDLCPELGVLLEPQTVLGYIVFRILDSKYPTCPKIVIDIPRANIAASLVGLEDDDELLAMLQSLLNLHQVHILQIKYMIEYFISAYQKELPKVGSVDENLIIATERTKAALLGKKYEPPEKKDDISEESRPASASSRDSSTTAETDKSEKNEKTSKKGKKDKKKSKGGKGGKGGKEKVKEPKEIKFENKEVQTEDDKYKVELTPIAALGKLAFETLAIGEKISDELMTRMLIEYIKSNNLLRWVLINYPENYSQAKLMEEALVGVSLPSEEEVVETLETLEGVELREVEQQKPMRKKGCSRLVPNTLGTAACDFPKSYLTAYIALVKKVPSEEEGECWIGKVEQVCPVSRPKSASVLSDNSVAAHRCESQSMPQGAGPSASTSGWELGTLMKCTNTSKTTDDIKAHETSSKTADINLLRKESVKWKDDIRESMEIRGEMDQELESETLFYEEIDGEQEEEEAKEGNITSQEIQEEKRLCPLEKFYLNQGISYKCSYEDLNLQMVKDLAKIIIGDSDDVTKASVELFGPVVEELEEYLTNKLQGKDVTWNAEKLVPPQMPAKAKEKEEKFESSEDKRQSIPEIKAEDETPKKGKKSKVKENKKKKGKKEKKTKKAESTISEQATIKTEESFREAEEDLQVSEPEPELQPEKEVYMNFDVPQELLVTLATIWENLEEVYVKDFKEAFFMKRIYDAAIYPYAAFVKNGVQNLIKGADSKQIFVHDFQMQFNAIEQDLRSDVEVKSELHARVYELRMALYDIADGHKFDVESERQRIIRTHWVTEHMGAITNIFLLAIQLEADRFVDTLQIIRDYYTGMLDKPPTESAMQKVMVTRIELATPTTTPPEYESEDSIEDLLQESSVEDVSADVRENQSERDVSPVLRENQSETKTTERSKHKYVSEAPREKKTIAEVMKSASHIFESRARNRRSTVRENLSIIQPPEVSASNEAARKISFPEKSEVIPRKTDDQGSPGDTAKNFVEDVLIDAETDSTALSPFHSVISDTVESVKTVMDGYIQKQLEVVEHEESALNKKDNVGKKWKDRDTSPEAELKKAKIFELRAMSNKFFGEWRTALNSEAERANARLQLILKRAFQDLDDIIQWGKSLFHGLHEQIAARYKGEIAAVDELCKVLCNAIEDEQRIQEELVIDGDDFFTRPYVLMFPRPSPEEPPPVEEPYLDNTFRVEQLRRLLEIFRTAAPSGLMPERALCYILEDLITCRSEGHELPPLWYQLTPLEVPELLEAIYGKVEYVEWREFIIRGLGLSYPSMRQVLKMRKEFQKYDGSLKGIVTSDVYNQITLWFEKNVPEDEVTQLHIRLAKELLLDMFQASDSEFGYSLFLLNFCKDEDPKRGLAKAFALKLGKPVVATEDEYKVYQQVLEEEERKRQKELEEATITANEVIWQVTDDAVQTASGIIVKEVVEQIGERAVEYEEQKQLLEEVIENVEGNNIAAEDQQEEDEMKENEEGKEMPLSDDRTEIIYQNSLSSSSTYEEETKDVLNAAVKIPAEVLVNVLTASLPWHGKAENVLEAGEKSLLMKLDQVFDELGDEHNCVIAHEFLSHKFIRDLLNTTHKFHAFHLEEKVELICITNEFLETLVDQVAKVAM